MTAIVDTATDLIAIESDECKTCGHGDVQSDVGIQQRNNMQIGVVKEFIDYGAYNFHGSYGTTEICLSIKDCEIVDFFYIKDVFEG